MDEILQAMGFNTNGARWDSMTPDERETARQWVESVQQNQMTVDRIKDFIGRMRQSVEAELTKHDLSKEQDLFLKARLRNLLMLDAFLKTPEEAKKALQTALK